MSDQAIRCDNFIKVITGHKSQQFICLPSILPLLQRER